MQKYLGLLSLIIAVSYAYGSDDDIRKITTSRVGQVAAYVESNGLQGAQEVLAGSKVSSTMEAERKRVFTSHIQFSDHDVQDESEEDFREAGKVVDLRFSQDKSERDPHGTAGAAAADEQDLTAAFAALPASDFEKLGDPVTAFLESHSQKPLPSYKRCKQYVVDGTLMAVLVYSSELRSSVSQVQYVVADDSIKQTKKFRQWLVEELEKLTNQKNPAHNLSVNDRLFERLQDEFEVVSTFNFRGPKWKLATPRK